MLLALEPIKVSTDITQSLVAVLALPGAKQTTEGQKLYLNGHLSTKLTIVVSLIEGLKTVTARNLQSIKLYKTQPRLLSL